MIRTIMAASASKNTPGLTNNAVLKLLFLTALNPSLNQAATNDPVTIKPPGSPAIQTLATGATPNPTSHTLGPLPPVECSKYANTKVNLTQLSSAVYWYFEEESQCHDAGAKDVCQFSFAFCRALPPEATPKVNPGEYGASQLTSGKPGSKATILGKIGMIEGDNDEDGLQLIARYRGGDDASDVCKGKEKKLSVDLHLHCDNTTKWQTPHKGQPGKMPKMTKAIFLKDECKYVVTTLYDGACGVMAPVTPTTSSGLSAGSVIIIVFLSLAVAYLVIGVIYNMVKGAHGLELIPNYDMWRMFPADVVGGMAFVWRIITCQGGTRTKVYDDL